MHVLLVIRNSSESNRLAEAVENLGHSVSVQHSGTAALLCIPTRQPDAVLCADILPDTDAITLLRSLRESCPDIPIAILTSILTHISDEIALRNAGASSIIASACDSDSLLIQLSHFLSLPPHRILKQSSQTIDFNYFESLVGRLGTEILDLRDEMGRYKQEVMHADRLRNLGMFSSGIIHDINNILCGIIGHAELGKLASPSHEPDRYVDIIKGASRACEIAHQVLDYANQVPQGVSTCNPESTLREAIQLIRASIPGRIQLILDVQPELPPVAIDENKIHQIVLNLVTNAWHAFDRKNGSITVTLAARNPSSQHLSRCHTLKDTQYVVLEVKDTASGIPYEIRSRIFHPFFSTKQRGQGSGMGLFVVKSLLDGANGAITVDSEPGLGSTFSVFLPLVQSVQLRKAPARTRIRGKDVPRRILVVDDEQLLASAVSEILSTQGHQVTTFIQPMDAIRYLGRDQDIDVVITDLAMPQMNGFDLAEHVKSAHPEIPVILLSGNLPLLKRHEVDRLGLFHSTLKKPFSPKELQTAIRNVLDPNQKPEAVEDPSI